MLHQWAPIKMAVGVVMHDFLCFLHSEGLLCFRLLFKIIPTVGNGYRFLIPIVINRIGCINYISSSFGLPVIVQIAFHAAQVQKEALQSEAAKKKAMCM